MQSGKRITAVCGLLALFAVLIFSHILPSQKLTFTPAFEEERISSGFIIKLYEGRIAVFEPQSDAPLRITEISEESLRHFDREKLKAGITVASEEELLMRLEDFGS